MSTMTGVTVCVPASLIDAARETVALFYLDPSQRENLRAEFSGDGSAPATPDALTALVHADGREALNLMGLTDQEPAANALTDAEADAAGWFPEPEL